MTRDNPPEQQRRIVRFGVFEVDLATGELRKRGARVRLRGRPFDVLALLLERRGSVVTREELRERLWAADTFVDFDHGLNTSVNRLREALGDSADSPRFVETLPRRGYRFIAPLEGPASGSESDAADSAALTTAPFSRQRPMRPLLALGVVVLVAVLAMLIRTRLSEERREGIRSLAVLPLVNLSRDPAEEYFADGMTDALIAKLAEIRGLKVISRTSAMRYKGTREPIPRIAQALGVEAVVEGSVLRQGERVRVTGQLIHAASDDHLWAASYERHIGDVLALQREVAATIAREIRLELANGRSEEQRVNPAAYNAYLIGRYHWNKRTPDGFRKALAAFQEALAQDPGDAQALAGIADCYNMLAAYNLEPHGEAMPRARAAAERALALREDLGEAHASLGWALWWHAWDWAAAEHEYRRALELSPGYATAHQWYGIYLTGMGRFAEAKAELARALELDPLSLPISENQAFVRYCAREYPQAIEKLQMTLELEPGYPHAHRYLGLCLLKQGQAARAIAELERTRAALPGETEVLAQLAVAHAAAGATRQARDLLDELTHRASTEYVSPWLFAIVCSGLGERDRALDWLDRAYTERAGHMAFLKVDPLLDGLRGQPRFEELLRRLRL